MLELGPECAVLVLPRGNRQEQTVIERRLLLQIVAERLYSGRLQCRVLHEGRRRLKSGRARSQPATLRANAVVLDVGVFCARRRLEIPRRRWLPCTSACELRGEVPATPLDARNVADARRCALLRTLVELADVELVLAR